jgi:hypothetical protein
MLLGVRIGKDGSTSVPYRTGHKPLALLYSLALHGGVVALLFLPVSFGSSTETVYNSVVVQLEKDHKLIYYDFHKELPEVSAANPTARVTTPSPDALKSKQTIVIAPKDKPGKQLVYLPEPRVKLQTDLTAPNLIAIETPVKVPLPDRPKPKPFQAPETRSSVPPQVTPLPNAPALAADANSKDASLNALLNKPSGPLKQFTPPPRTNPSTPTALAALPSAPAVGAAANDSAAISALFNKPAGPPPKQFTPPALPPSSTGSTPAPLPSAPVIAGGGSDKNAALSALLNRPSGPPPKPFKAPTPTAGPSGGAASGSSATSLPVPPPVPTGGAPAAATVAIIGLNPSNVPQIPRPEGSRSARIEAGTPIPGATHAELGGGNSAISVPDVSIQGVPATAPSTATRVPLDGSTPDPAIGLARPQAPQVLATTPHVSVPQWPNTRSLPAAVERHFQNRVVYITLIPVVSGNEDWTVWFADLALAPTDPNIVVQPPTLMRAGALPPIPAHNDRGNGRIRLTGVVGKDGRLGSLADLTGAPADRELAEALQSWQFGPARRNGVIFDADAVIEIPVVFGKLSLR